jgi:glycosyltransferase involved in cell wall biosynthesis
VPDLIIGHPGWGETIHLRDVYPNTPQILFGEFYYQSRGGDYGFDPEFSKVTLADDMRITAKNATQSLAYTMADRILCPTRFQASTFPAAFQPQIRVLHEGVDLDRSQRRPDARLAVADGPTLDATTPVITYISRTLEPLRGFHIFMRALPAMLAACPDAHVLVIGEAVGAGYGTPPPEGQTWKDRLLAELGDRLDLGRVHFLGTVTHPRMIDALSISAAHIYYTYPFVLSWSLVEAMACECLVLGSDTGPVRDAIEPGVSGVLNDFFDVDALAQGMIAAIRTPDAFASLRAAARRTAIRDYDRATVGVPGWLRTIDEVVGVRA